MKKSLQKLNEMFLNFLNLHWGKFLIGVAIICLLAMIRHIVSDVMYEPPVDVVKGITPGVEATREQLDILDSLMDESAAEQNAILTKEWPNLATALIGWLRNDGKITPSETIGKVELFFGSGKATGEDISGSRYQGFFRQELLASISIAGREQPLVIAIRCKNGLYDVVSGDIYHSLGTWPVLFTIKKGENLLRYVSYETAIYLAKVFDLPIHQGRGEDRRAITPETASAINTDQSLVRVLVQPGDVFDLANMTYHGKEAKKE